MGLVLVTFLKSCPAWIVIGLHFKSAKNCGIHFTYDEDVDLFLIFFYLTSPHIRKKLQFF